MSSKCKATLSTDTVSVVTVITIIIQFSYVWVLVFLEIVIHAWKNCKTSSNTDYKIIFMDSKY